MTELGDKVDEYLYWKWVDEEEWMADYGKGYLQDEVRELIEEGGWDVVAPFFEHLDTSWIESLTFMNGLSTLGMQIKAGSKKRRGSAIEQMKANHAGGFNWLIKQLEAQKPN